jgi:hypothetical protein
VTNLAAIADILFTATVVFLAYNLGSVNRRLNILETWIERHKAPFKDEESCEDQKDKATT